jgi:hypothetical protein
VRLGRSAVERQCPRGCPFGIHRTPDCQQKRGIVGLTLGTGRVLGDRCGQMDFGPLEVARDQVARTEVIARGHELGIEFDGLLQVPEGTLPIARFECAAGTFVFLPGLLRRFVTQPLQRDNPAVLRGLVLPLQAKVERAGVGIHIHDVGPQDASAPIQDGHLIVAGRNFAELEMAPHVHCGLASWLVPVERLDLDDDAIQFHGLAWLVVRHFATETPSRRGTTAELSQEWGHHERCRE